MRRAKYLIILGICLNAELALGQDADANQDPNAGSNSVSGMFAGMNVGGSRRRVAHEARNTQKRGKSSDSFAVSPSDYASQMGSPNQNRVQNRQVVVPGLETQERRMPEPVVEAPPAAPSEEAAPTGVESVAQTVDNAQSLSNQVANPASAEYYNGLIDQVRGKSDEITGTAPPKTKFAVTNDNKF